jgi:probable HAF family extracellular repeat protein
MIELDGVGGRLTLSQAADINPAGQIVGASQTESGELHATLWTRE